MSNPVLVEAMRGTLVESRHRGAVAVADADSRAVLALGEVGRAVYPRSAIKALQALTLIESGGARSDFLFSNVRENAPATDVQFTFKAPAGVELRTDN